MSENKYNNNFNFGGGVHFPVPLNFSPFSHRHDNIGAYNDDSYVMSDFSESSSNVGAPVKGSSTSSSSASDEDGSPVDLSDFLATERGYVEQLTSLLSYMERREQRESDLYDTISNIKRIHSISKETWSIESWVRRILVFDFIISLLTLLFFSFRLPLGNPIIQGTFLCTNPIFRMIKSSKVCTGFRWLYWCICLNI